MREKGKFFAYKHTCKQEHIEQLGHNAFLTKEEAEAEAAKINATVQADATPSHAMTVKDSLFCLAGREMEAEELLAGLLKAQSLYVSE